MCRVRHGARDSLEEPLQDRAVSAAGGRAGGQVGAAAQPGGSAERLLHVPCQRGFGRGKFASSACGSPNSCVRGLVGPF